MIIFLLLVQAALCCALLFREIRRRSYRNFATSTFFVVYMIVYIVAPLLLHIFYGGPRSIIAGSDHSNNDVLVHLIFNVMGIALLISSIILSYIRTSCPPRQGNQQKFPEKMGDVIGITLIIGTLLFIQSTGLAPSELITASRFAWFESVNYSAAYSVVAAYLLALSAVYIYLIKTNAPYNRLLLLAAIIAVIAYGLITKDRKWIFFFISGWLAANHYSNGHKLNITSKAILGMVVLFFLVILSQFIRDALPRYFLDQNFDPSNELYASIDYMVQYSDLSYFYRATIEAIHQNVNNGFGIFLGLPRRILFLLVPQGLSGGIKVEDISAIFSDVVGGEDSIRRGNMPPGLFGLFILSFGWVFSILLMPLLALTLHLIDGLLEKPRGLINITVATSLLTSTVFAFRGDESTAFYFPVINILLLALIANALRFAPFLRLNKR